MDRPIKRPKLGRLFIALLMIVLSIKFHSYRPTTISASLQGHGVWIRTGGYGDERTMKFERSSVTVQTKNCKKFFSQNYPAIASTNAIYFPTLGTMQHISVNYDAEQDQQILTVSEIGPLWPGTHYLFVERCFSASWFKKECVYYSINACAS